MEAVSSNVQKIAMIDIFALLPGHSVPRKWLILCYAPCNYLPLISANLGVIFPKYNELIYLLCKHPNWNQNNFSDLLQPPRTGFHVQYAPTITNILYHYYTFIPLSMHALHSRTIPVKAHHQQGPVSL